jgi:hypothetical protein
VTAKRSGLLDALGNHVEGKLVRKRDDAFQNRF